MSKFFTPSRGAWALTAVALTLLQGCAYIRQRVREPREIDVYREAVLNQTTAEARDILTEDAEALGTGVFVVPAPELGPLDVRVILVRDLTYAECVRRGSLVRAFKFVPYRLIDPDELPEMLASGCGQSCGGGDPIRYCPHFCPCDGGICQPERE